MGTWKIEGDTSYISGSTTGEGTSFNVSFKPNTGESATGVAQIFTITYTEDGKDYTTEYTLPYCKNDGGGEPEPEHNPFFKVDFKHLNGGSWHYNELRNNGGINDGAPFVVSSSTWNGSSYQWADVTITIDDTGYAQYITFDSGTPISGNNTAKTFRMFFKDNMPNETKNGIHVTVKQNGTDLSSGATFNVDHVNDILYNDIRPYVVRISYEKPSTQSPSGVPERYGYYLHFKSYGDTNPLNGNYTTNEPIAVNNKVTFFADDNNCFTTFIDGSDCGGQSCGHPQGLPNRPYINANESDTLVYDANPITYANNIKNGVLLRNATEACVVDHGFEYRYSETDIDFLGATSGSTIIQGYKSGASSVDSYYDGVRSVYLRIPKQNELKITEGPHVLKASQVTFNSNNGDTTVSVYEDGAVFVDSGETAGEMFSSITQFETEVYPNKSYSYIEACSLFNGEDLNQHCINDIAINNQGELIRTGSTVDVYTYGTNPVTVSGECITDEIDAEVEIWRQSTASMVVGTEPEKEVIEYRTITYTENDFPHNVTSHTFTEDVEYSGKTYPTDITVESTCILRDAHIYISATTIESESVELSGFEIGIQGHELNDKEFTLSGSWVLTANTEIEINSGSNNFISMTYENYDFAVDASIVYPNTINAIIDGQTLSFTKSVSTYVSEEIDSELKLDYKFFKNDDESMKIVVIIEEKKNLIPDYCEPLHYENSEGNTTLNMRWTGIDTRGNIKLDYEFGQYTTKSFAATSAQSMIGHIISNNTGGVLGTISSNCQNLENYAVILINTASYGTWPGGSMSTTGETKLTFTAQNDSSVTYKVSMYYEIDENNRLLLRGAMVNKVVRIPYTGYNSKIQFYCYPYTFDDKLYTNGVSISYLTNPAEGTLTGKNMANDAVNGDGLSLSLSNINDSILDYELTYSIAQNNECKFKEFVVQIGNSINEGENYYGRSLGSNHYAAFVHFVQEYKVKNRIYFGTGFLAHKTYDDNYNLTSSSTYEYHAFFETCSSMVLEGDEVVIEYNNVAFPLTDDFEYDVSMDDPTKEIEIITDNYMWGDTPMRIIKGGQYYKVKFTKKS